jgi:methyl-accepting chemotaxis protein
MRRTSIRLRLAVSVGVLAVLMVVIGLVGAAGLSSAAAGTRRLGTALQLTHAAMQAKFRTADFAGWQTGYAFDFLRGVPHAASDDVGQRKEFLASTAGFRADLGDVARYPLTAREKALLSAIRSTFDQFLAVDRQIATGYRAGSPSAIAASNQLASGRSLQLFGTLADDTNELAASVTARGNALENSTAASAHDLIRILLGVAGVGLLLGIGVAVAVVRSVVRPLNDLQVRMGEIADGDGDLTQRVDDTGRDELASVARAFNSFVSTISDTVRLVGEQATTLSAASQELTATSQGIAEQASEASSQAASATDAASSISGSVSSASVGAEQMSSSIQEIAVNAANASRVAADAVTEAQHANRVVAKLGSSSAEIGEVVRVIAGIAEQTNLLALNATIEAARAGEAGKGFAVVANEVKDLSQGTARATEQIGRQVTAIQTEINDAIATISRITDVIAGINEYQTSIAAAVEEQNTVSREMSRSVADAAEGVQNVFASIKRLADASEFTATGVAESQVAAQSLAQLGSELEGAVGRFTWGVTDQPPRN